MSVNTAIGLLCSEALIIAYNVVLKYAMFLSMC